jgi:glycosyltransferase involved in cell wall biosynthesis
MPAAEAFRLGRLLAVPSRQESFPYVVLEAGAAGIPLVATDVGGIPEIVAGTGHELVPAGDPAALAAAIRATLGDPAQARARAGRLTARVKERFTVEGMADGVLAFYGDRLGARQRKARGSQAELVRGGAVPRS